MVNAIPEGFSTITPHIICSDVAKAIEFYKKAFAAEDVCSMPGPDGKGVMHAEISIGNSRLMLGQENPQWNMKSPTTLGGTPVTIHLYVEDCDASYKRAIDAGATSIMPPDDAFWGDRYSTIADPFGHSWSLATHTKDLTEEQINENAKEFFKKMPDCS